MPDPLATALEKLRIGRQRRHVVLCVGGKCAPREQAEQSWEHLKRRLRELGLQDAEGGVLRTRADCLRVCMAGPVAVVYPDGTWYRLIITAPDPLYRQVRAMIDQLDSRRAQVYIESLIVEVAGADLGERGANFVKVLAENDRLSLLPEISAQFETLKAKAEGTLEATITSAQELTQPQVDDLVAGLKARFNRAVNVQVAVDPELIGGAVITIGDQVIDGSVKGRLQRMSFAIQA